MGFTLGLRLSVLFSFPRADLSLVKSITLSRLVMFLIRSKYNSFFFFIHLRPQNINFSKTLYFSLRNCIKETVKIIRWYFSIVKSRSIQIDKSHHLRYEEEEKGIARAWNDHQRDSLSLLVFSFTSAFSLARALTPSSSSLPFISLAFALSLFLFFPFSPEHAILVCDPIAARNWTRIKNFLRRVYLASRFLSIHALAPFVWTAIISYSQDYCYYSTREKEK